MRKIFVVLRTYVVPPELHEVKTEFIAAYVDKYQAEIHVSKLNIDYWSFYEVK